MMATPVPADQFIRLRVGIFDLTMAMAAPGRLLTDEEYAAVTVLTALGEAVRDDVVVEMAQLVLPWALARARHKSGLAQPCRIEEVADIDDYELLRRAGDYGGTET